MNPKKNDPGLVTTQWLARNLSNPDLRIYDCSVILQPTNEPGQPFAAVSGRRAFEQAHIPRAQFLDVPGELSAPTPPGSRLTLSFPERTQLEEVMRAKGLNQDNMAVLYSTSASMWSTRVWWILRAYGFTNAAVLDGGFPKWSVERRETTGTVESPPVGDFVAAPRNDDMVATREDVLCAIDSDSSAIIDSLSCAMYRGRADNYYGRPGHIKSAKNVSVVEELHDSDTNCFISLAAAQRIYDERGLDKSRTVISYCGGGIAATVNAFMLTRLGYENVAIYDNSMNEWGFDESLPMDAP